MGITPELRLSIRARALVVALFFLVSSISWAQGQRSGGGLFGRAPAAPLPDPVAVVLPTLSGEVTGPGARFDSAPSQARGLGLADFRYETNEYFVSGTADGRPYNTRLVVRRPSNDRDFSGLVLAESMHSSGAAHVFEYTAVYVMDSGHAAVEILTTSPRQFSQLNSARYGDLVVEDGQANEILAQVGALVKSEQGPFAGQAVRKMVLSGTSMSSGTLINYLPGHQKYRRPNMQHIYDGFMPTSTGATIQPLDVPLIQLPTMHEVETNVPRRQDSDEVGDQYRLYEFAAIGHVDSRDNVRLLPNPCVNDLSTFPLQAYMAVGLHHLFGWVDQGVIPPRAQRVLLDRNVENDGSTMLLDAHGNAVGGIRSPYVDVPNAKYTPVNTAATPLIDNPSAYVASAGMMGANIMCRLSAYQESFSRDKLAELYGNARTYRRMFEESVNTLETQGWSLPVYREMILADAEAVNF
jgi:hypothetical protein